MAVVLPILIAFLLSAFSLAAQVKEPRTTVSLDGTWKIADSVAADAGPAVYDHSVPVSGLAHSATPTFKNVDEFQSRQLLSNLVDQGMYSKVNFDKLNNNMNEHPMLLVNVAANNNHWLGVITVGTKSNRDGIGAQVTAFSGDHKWMHEVRSGSSYISSNDLRLHFGLGSVSTIDRIAVRWPSGLHEVF